jgi:uncharacterized protein involved in exopolysaccharide biosynthesis
MSKSAMNETKDIAYLRGIIRRRRKGFLLPFLLILFVGSLVAFILPPVYLSKSTILIENQLIPQEYVHTTITSYVEERLQMITQQIMSRSKLMGIINQFRLYQEMLGRYTTEEIIQKMRDDIEFQPISTDVIDKRTGRSTAATIAFSLSYEGKNPSTVQKVANVLASLYLEENLRSREQRASTTTDFLQQELDQIKEQIDHVQNQISEFKKTHSGGLPEHTALNIQAVDRLNRDLDHLDAQLNSLEERKILLQGQIVNVDPLNPVVTEDGKTVMNPHERLKYLRMQLISLQSSLSKKHPDIKKLKKEIQELESRVESPDDSIEKVRRLTDLRAQLAVMEGKLGPKHPDVARLSKEVMALSREVESIRTTEVADELGRQMPDNPAYINLKIQIGSTDLRIKNLLAEKGQIKQKIAEYQRKIETAPMVEKGYNNLMRDYESARLKYNEIMSKLMEARVAQGMEETQRGERFTIIEAAGLPEKPHKPNRVAVTLIAFVLALGAGVGMAAVRETLDTSVKTPDQLNRLTAAPVLSVISLLESAEERRSRRIKWLILILVAVGAVVLALFIINQFVMPLDILWIKIQRRMMKITVV